MTSFMLLYHGPATTPEASHEGWPEWFQSLGDKLVDRGSPMTAGFVVAADPPAASLNGYTIIRAQDRDAVRDLLRNHSFLAEGSDCASTSTNCPASSTAEHSDGADAGPP